MDSVSSGGGRKGTGSRGMGEYKAYGLPEYVGHLRHFRAAPSLPQGTDKFQHLRVGNPQGHVHADTVHLLAGHAVKIGLRQFVVEDDEH